MLQMVLFIYEPLIVTYSVTMRPDVHEFAFQDYRSLHSKQQMFSKQTVVLCNKLFSKPQCASNQDARSSFSRLLFFSLQCVRKHTHMSYMIATCTYTWVSMHLFFNLFQSNQNNSCITKIFPFQNIFCDYDLTSTYGTLISSVTSKILIAAKLPKMQILSNICPNVFSSLDQLCPKFDVKMGFWKNKLLFRTSSFNILHQIHQNLCNLSLIALENLPKCISDFSIFTP